MSLQVNNQILGSGLSVEKAVEHEVSGDTNSCWKPLNGPQNPTKETGGTGDKRKKNRDHPDYSIVNINLEKARKNEDSCCHSDCRRKQLYIDPRPSRQSRDASV